MFSEGPGIRKFACRCLVVECATYLFAPLVLCKPLDTFIRDAVDRLQAHKGDFEHQDSEWVLECQYTQQSPVSCFPRSYLNESDVALFIHKYKLVLCILIGMKL
jgi:hypothetical protein